MSSADQHLSLEVSNHERLLEMQPLNNLTMFLAFHAWLYTYMYAPPNSAHAGLHVALHACARSGHIVLNNKMKP